MRSIRSVPHSQPDRLALLALVVLGMWLFIVSESVLYGDATTYAANVLSGTLIEPGHLLWRPLGRLSYILLGRHSNYSSVLWQLQFLSLVASLLALMAMYLLVSKLAGRTIAFLMAILMMVSNGFWAYSFSGCSYSVSVLFVVISLRFAVADAHTPATPRGALAAGIFGGLAAATWAIQLLAAPAIWLALLLTPPPDSLSIASRFKNTVRLATGYLATFFIPLILAYLIQVHEHTLGHGGPGGKSVSFVGWLASARHGIRAYFGAAQLLRVAMGWPQSIVSTYDIGSKLRLWRLGEGPFPFSPSLAVFGVFYCALAAGLVVLARGWNSSLGNRDRGAIVSAATAILTNLLFAAAWQGTDLERYFPSWPFQLVLLALIVKLAFRHHTRTAVLMTGATMSAALGLVNWYGTFEPVLAPDSYRQVWLHQLKRVANSNDLLITFGQRTDVIVSPHDPDLPKIDNLSLEIVMRGSSWRDGELPDIAKTKKRGGRVFLADALFWTGDGPRDGWSFKEYPSPSPSTIRKTFLPFKSDRVGFIAAGEKVWLGK